jgi:hypothetical protein
MYKKFFYGFAVLAIIAVAFFSCQNNKQYLVDYFDSVHECELKEMIE